MSPETDRLVKRLAAVLAEAELLRQQTSEAIQVTLDSFENSWAVAREIKKEWWIHHRLQDQSKHLRRS